MEIKRVWAVYFSPVGGTEMVVTAAAESAAGELGLPLHKLDFTLPAVRQEVTAFDAADLVFFAVPTYAGKTPNKLLPWLQSGFAGNGAQPSGKTRTDRIHNLLNKKQFIGQSKKYTTAVIQK